MNLNDILNQVLGAGQKMAQNSSNPQNDTLLKVGGGMAAGTLLSMLLGRKGTGQIAKAGSLAAVGALAYRAYQNWQQSQNQNQAGEDASRIILRTMIAAAAADGNITAGEEQILLGEIGQNNADIQQWLAQEIRQPASPEALASDIGNDLALASEAYLAARIICGDLERKEIAFLSRFAEALKLDETLVEKLERQAGF